MFLFTVTKPGLRQAGALALCAVCLCGTVAAAVHFSGGAVTASAAAVPGIETTQDIGTYFTGYGFDTDLASAAVDKVKIPKKWDDSFAAFNQIVQESGLDLADYKGKTVEKWTVLCPQLSTGDHDTYCVLLVYKAKAVGAVISPVTSPDPGTHSPMTNGSKPCSRSLASTSAWSAGSQMMLMPTPMLKVL